MTFHVDVSQQETLTPEVRDAIRQLHDQGHIVGLAYGDAILNRDMKSPTSEEEEEEPSSLKMGLKWFREQLRFDAEKIR